MTPDLHITLVKAKYAVIEADQEISRFESAQVVDLQRGDHAAHAHHQEMAAIWRERRVERQQAWFKLLTGKA